MAADCKAGGEENEPSVTSSKKKKRRGKMDAFPVGSPLTISQGTHQGKEGVVAGGHSGYVQAA